MSAEEVEVEDEKPRTLFVGNIPRQVSKRDLETVFGEAGPLKRCFIQYPRKEGKYRAEDDDTTVAYVTYALAEDAVKALENLNGHKFGSNKISLKFAKSRTEQNREPRPNFPNFTDRDHRNIPAPERAPRPKRIKKKSRLIIRNLSFEVNEENLRKYFESYGNITDINILRKQNGKLVGCAFVQFTTVPEAARAIRELNAKPFLGRPIAIDWALPKEKFQESFEGDATEVKAEENSGLDPEVKIKAEPLDDYEQQYDYVEDSLQMKTEEDDEDDEDSSEDGKKDRKRKQKNDKPGMDSDSDDGNDGKRRKLNSNDADEGKTLFIRNLEFETTAEELKAFFSAYGPLNYAVVCKDKLTEHPKGTAFAMFRNPADASKCLADFENEPTKFNLGRRQFVISLALSKTKLESKLQEGVKKEPKDKRNLFLAREGFVRPESNAAIGVSAADMNKRAAIQRVKRQMLKNLSIFISDTRLCVHNLPPSLSDTALRKIFVKHGGPGAKVTEARVMRDLLDKDLNGIGTSKEYGFVTFSTHEHALTALRAVNNNPKIFTPARRPIVEFSLENRAAIKAKEKRAEKSREKNLAKQTKTADVDESKDGMKAKKKKRQKEKVNKNETLEASARIDTIDTDELPSFTGLTSKVGISSLPSIKPKGKISRKSLKPAKSKGKKKLQERRKREPQIKPKMKIRDDKAEKLIARHKKSLRENEAAVLKKKKSKWYQ